MFVEFWISVKRIVNGSQFGHMIVKTRIQNHSEHQKIWPSESSQKIIQNSTFFKSFVTFYPFWLFNFSKRWSKSPDDFDIWLQKIYPKWLRTSKDTAVFQSAKKFVHPVYQSRVFKNLIKIHLKLWILSHSLYFYILGGGRLFQWQQLGMGTWFPSRLEARLWLQSLQFAVLSC